MVFCIASLRLQGLEVERLNNMHCHLQLLISRTKGENDVLNLVSMPLGIRLFC